MDAGNRNRLLLGVCLVLLVLFIYYQLLYRGSTFHTLPRTYASPNHHYLLTARVVTDSTAENYTHVILDIRDRAGKLLYTDDTHASNATGWSIQWVGNNRIMLNSGDIGMLYWQLSPSGQWENE